MPTKKKGVFISKGKSDPDPWCLVCGVNLRLDGRSFVALTNDDAEETRNLFVKVLGTQFKKEYASVNLCGKCERALQRINRYSELESAQKEADNLKKSLAENIKRTTPEDSPSKSGKKAKSSSKGSKGDGQKSDPLIEDEAEDWRDNQELVQEEEEEVEDPVNADPNKMPFGLFKKSKKDKKEKKDKKKDKDESKTELVESQAQENKPVAETHTEQEKAPPQQFKEGTTLAAMASTLPKKPEPVREWEHEFEALDGGYVPAPSKTPYQPSQSTVQEKTDPEKPVDKEETEVKKLEVKDGVVKSENSPLITKNGEAKESKLQDQQPGMLCCTIL